MYPNLRSPKHLIISSIHRSYVRITLANVFDALEPDRPKGAPRRLTRDIFQDLLEESVTIEALAAVDVDAKNMLDLEQLLFEASNSDVMEFHEFVEAVLNLRQSNLATIQDVLQSRQLQQKISNTILTRSDTKFLRISIFKTRIPRQFRGTGLCRKFE